MPRIAPFLWFDTQAEEAAEFYFSVFPNSRIVAVSRRPEGVPGPAGEVMIVSFELEGQTVHAMNGGPHFALSPAFSFAVACADQAEVDQYWERLLEGGEPSQCGWLTDRFGLSWQVWPRALEGWMADPDPVRKARLMEAVMGMVKLDEAALRAAYTGE